MPIPKPWTPCGRTRPVRCWSRCPPPAGPPPARTASPGISGKRWASRFKARGRTMIELKTRAEQFLRSIQAEGERQCAAIRAKTDTEVTQSLAAAREEEQARAARTIAFETARAKTQANRALSAARAEARAALTARRQALTDGVFADAEARL